MSVKKLSYKEHEGKSNFWSFDDATFLNCNLIVGKNSTGKSRLISVLHSFSQLILGNFPILTSGMFDIHLKIKHQHFHYQMLCENKAVISEVLEVDGELKLERKQDGSGKIFYEKIKNFFEFKLPSDVIAVVNRRDEIQHPYLITLHKWAQSVSLILFGSDFGRGRLSSIEEVMDVNSNVAQNVNNDAVNLVKTYGSALRKYGEKFQKAVINDMRQLGYNLTDVGAKNVQQILPDFPFSAFTLFTKEEELGFDVPQFHMSQGMFRALALVINLNVYSFSKEERIILIDDIGEGLDYERATAIVGFLMEKSISSKLQIIMTTNDRFIMNKVPLKYWSIMKRKGGIVRIYNEVNSPETFEQFKFIGLSNFDLFSSEFFEKVNGDE
ncbi:ATP-binding protein [Rahnella sp. CFA14(1/10)]|uniref:ATP-binding protein n=1 Tax=Rahnella sp. CFA14(1/10) TaxID=2511203 RepID=UPI0010206CB2|nr:ATP-binding protein [Rahnella sp. CFA14(1/10)]